MKVFAWGIAVLVGIVLSATGSAYAGGAEGPAGQKLFVKYRCQSCHSIKALKLEKKKGEVEDEEAKEAGPASTASTKKKEPPDLSGVGLTRKVEWVQGWLLKKELIDGKKHLKKFRGTPAELKTISAWLVTLKTKVDKGKVAEQ